MIMPPKAKVKEMEIEKIGHDGASCKGRFSKKKDIREVCGLELLR